MQDSLWPGIVSDFHKTQMILKYATDIMSNGNLFCSGHVNKKSNNDHNNRFNGYRVRLQKMLMLNKIILEKYDRSVCLLVSKVPIH